LAARRCAILDPQSGMSLRGPGVNGIVLAATTAQALAPSGIQQGCHQHGRGPGNEFRENRAQRGGSSRVGRAHDKVPSSQAPSQGDTHHPTERHAGAGKPTSGPDLSLLQPDSIRQAENL